MANARSFALGAAFGLALTGSIMALVKNVAPLNWQAERLSQWVEERRTGHHHVHFRHPRDDVLIDHGTPMVDGDNPFTNHRFR